MGVDSGLPDFRGNEGRWGSIETGTKKSIFEIMNPKAFIKNPIFSWDLYASRMIQYAKTEPHNGFQIILNWIQKYNLDYFILTSNVDNQFQKAGYNKLKIRELHGSIFHLQCTVPCSNDIWENNIKLEQIKNNIQKEIFPKCTKCGEISRPNVYMFRDNTYLPERSKKQEKQFQFFLDTNKNNQIIVFEIGSGPHVQSIRKKTRMLGINYNTKIIRINPKDFKIKKPHIGIDKGALETLTMIEKYITNNS